jgi:hypothetical protein
MSQMIAVFISTARRAPNKILIWSDIKDNFKLRRSYCSNVNTCKQQVAPYARLGDWHKCRKILDTSYFRHFYYV